MKSFKLFMYVPLLILFIQSSCKKDNLTPETATGANTFSCKVNGKVYTPSGGDPYSGWYPVEGGWYEDVDNNRGLYIRTVSGNTKFIDLYLKILNAPGVYKLNYNTTPRPIAYRCENYGYYSIKDNNGNYSRFVTNTTYTNVKY